MAAPKPAALLSIIARNGAQMDGARNICESMRCQCEHAACVVQVTTLPRQDRGRRSGKSADQAQLQFRTALCWASFLKVSPPRTAEGGS